MQLTILQENFKRGLAVVGRAIPPKGSLPVLSNVLLNTEDGMLKLAGTNLAIGIICSIGAKVEQDGAITIPAKLLSEVVGNLPNEPITLSLDEKTQTLKLICGRFQTEIKGIEADEFPTIPIVQGQQPLVTLPGATLKEAIEQVSIAAATEDTRPVLAGICLRLSGS